MAKFHYNESPSLSQKEGFSGYLSEDEDLVVVTGLSAAYLRNKFIIFLLWPGLVGLALGFGLGWFFDLNKAIAFGLGIVLMFAITMLRTMHIYHANRYLLTTRRVIIKHGLFSVKVQSALYDKITHIEVDQSFMDRVFLHHGNIIINTAGVDKGEIVLHAVDYPMELKNLIERLINKERIQFGMNRGASTSTVEGEIID